MILRAELFSSVHKSSESMKMRAVRSFIEFLERKLGVLVVYDRHRFAWDPELEPQVALGHALVEAGVLNSFQPFSMLADEPPYRLWGVNIASDAMPLGSGASWEKDADALMIALIEALERHLWRQETDYFRHPRVASYKELAERGLAAIAPSRFAGYSASQRAMAPSRRADDETSLLWTEGVSLITGTPLFVPVQVVSGAARYREGVQEPLIRARTTNGLATWPTQSGARLAGALEVIEREAFMITWLNQFSPARLGIDALVGAYPPLAHIMSTLKRYRLEPHILALPIDAPTHVIGALIEDVSGAGPRFSIGLKAHRSLSVAVEKAVLEALRARRGTRIREEGDPESGSVPGAKVGHMDRSDYWRRAEHAPKLTFLSQGPHIALEERSWAADTEEAHLARIISWCKETGLECASVALTGSAKNPTKLHIEMTVIPELQPVHLFEKDFMEGGERWQSVPRKLGLTPRTRMFTDEPHPFA